MIDGRPQPPLLSRVLHKAPHLIPLRFINNFLKDDMAESRWYLGPHSMMHGLNGGLFFLKSQEQGLD
jgi:hypothetical protein